VFVEEQLQLLVDLQKLDSSILSLRHKIDSMPSHIAAEQAPYKEALKAYEATHQQHLSHEKKKKDKEHRIEDLSEKIKKLRARSPEIKTNKEYQAHLKEIESVETEIRLAEDDVLALMEVIEIITKNAEAENTRLTAAKTQAEALNKEREKEIEIIEQELQTLKDKRHLLADTVERELYTRYMNLLKTGRGCAVAEVKKEVCQGCNMNVPPQLFVEIKTSGTLFQCPQCRRILFYTKPVDEPQETVEGN
jgi:predicted  nucleic acid-binding Zn-ribbon protein